MTDSRLAGPVRIVGSGLLGASIGLGLSQHGVDVSLDDVSPSARRLAVDYGAGREAREDDAPALVVVAVPPDVTAAIVARELERYPDALVTDVASVKAAPLAELRSAGADLARYLGSHPMAGRERGGAMLARADLFLGRPWVIASHERTERAQVSLLEDLVLDLGAVPIELGVDEHDRSVALVSHAPQIVSSLMAARLVTGSEAALGLAGGGVRDVTRVAASDPALWVQIVTANAPAVADVLRPLRDDLDAVLTALEHPDSPGSRRTIADAIAAGNAGVARIPGKHGQDRRFGTLVVVVADRPGELARLLADVGEAGVNLEDLRIEHSPGAQIGLAEVSVLPEVERRLADELEGRGWTIVDSVA